MKIITNHLLSFTTTILLTCLTFLIVINTTILNDKYIINSLNKNNYYEDIYENIIENYENNTVSLAVDLDFTKIITKEMVKNDLISLIKSVYHNEELHLSDKEIANKIKELTSVYNPTKEEQKEIDSLIKNLNDIYEDEVLYFSEILNIIPNYFKIIKTTTNIMIIILGLIIINLIAIINFGLKQKSSISNIFLASGLICIALKLMIYSIYQNIVIINNEVSNLIINVLNNILNYILISGIIYVIIGLITRILLTFKENKYQKLKEQ